MPQVTKASLLTQARALLEKGWCQGEYAKDADGYPVHADNLEASSWCINGALIGIRVSSPHVIFELEYLLSDKVGIGIICWNDKRYRTQVEVLALMDKAIASPEAQELVEVA